MAKNKRKKYYAVAKGHKSGVYNSWGDCKEQVDGYSRNQYRGFATESEAKDYVQKYSDTSNTASSSSEDASSPTASYPPSTTEENSRKRIRREDYGTNDDYKQARTQSTPASTSSNVSTPYESGYYPYCSAENDDDPLRDYYHSHGFFGYR
mmetsp:Transcript_39514/g.95567  ORF Transcript_39514/g.95567 Transcript_39514/m.95567 type:complete len:151 (+) Transcript_39514:56-508(+)